MEVKVYLLLSIIQLNNSKHLLSDSIMQGALGLTENRKTVF